MAIGAIAVITMSVAAHAQSFSKSDNVVGFTVGVGGYYSGSGILYKDISRTPTLALYYEHCIVDNLWDEKSSIGIGGMLAFASAKAKNAWKSTTTVVGFRGALHYSFVPQLDVYAGMTLGYDIVSWKWDDKNIKIDGDSSSNFFAAGFIGARYYFNDNLAVFSEVGYNIALFNIGLCLKF